MNADTLDMVEGMADALAVCYASLGRCLDGDTNEASVESARSIASFALERFFAFQTAQEGRPVA